MEIIQDYFQNGQLNTNLRNTNTLGTKFNKLNPQKPYRMISVIDHANRAKGSPGEQIAVGVANKTPQTNITRDNT